MSARNDLGAGWPGIATRDELLQRLNARAAPAPLANFAPKGTDMDALRRLEAQDNERRIGQLAGSLGGASAGLEAGHAFARLEGYARAGFRRSR